MYYRANRAAGSAILAVDHRPRRPCQWSHQWVPPFL